MAWLFLYKSTANKENEIKTLDNLLENPTKKI